MAEEIVNKVAQANIQQIDLSEFLPKGGIEVIDLKDNLWNELVLKEKDFRDWVKTTDWSIYKNKNVCVYCSNEAIIPAWAYMLITSSLVNAKNVVFANPSDAKGELFFKNLRDWDITELVDQRVMVKGCSDIPNPNKAYVILTDRLVPEVKSLMFGEPCSAVPVFKKK